MAYNLSSLSDVALVLTHLPLDKMASISQTYSNAFSWMKML